MRQELRIDALTVVGDHELDVRTLAPQADLHASALGVNLMALDSRFQTTCCRRSASPTIVACESSTGCKRICLASAAGRSASIADSTTRTSSSGPTLITSLPCSMRDRSSMSSTSRA